MELTDVEFYILYILAMIIFVLLNDVVIYHLVQRQEKEEATPRVHIGDTRVATSKIRYQFLKGKAHDKLSEKYIYLDNDRLAIYNKIEAEKARAKGWQYTYDLYPELKGLNLSVEHHTKLISVIKSL